MEQNNRQEDDGVGDITVNNKDKFRLSNLPQEILLKIIKNLVPAPLRPGTGLPLPEAISASKKAMFNLCLVSRLFWNLTLPIMYTHMIITDQFQLISVLVNLVVYRQRRGWVRCFSMLADHSPFCSRRFTARWRNARFNSLVRVVNWVEKASQNPNQQADMSTIVDEVKGHLYGLLDLVMDMPAGEYGYQGQFTWRLYEFRLGELYHLLVQLVLHLQTSIEDILITSSGTYAPSLTPRSWQYTALEGFRNASNELFRGAMFASLQSIRKQAIPGMSSCRVRPFPMKPEYMRTIKWQFYCDDGEWFLPDTTNWRPAFFMPQTDLQIFAHVVELALFKSLTHPAVLRVLLGSCQNLKSFTYTTNVLSWEDSYLTPAWPAHEAQDNPLTTLQEAVDEVRGTLTSIRVGWHDWAADLIEEQEAAVAPHRIDVSGFPNLEHIDIDVHFRRFISSTEASITDVTDLE